MTLRRHGNSSRFPQGRWVRSSRSRKCRWVRLSRFREPRWVRSSKIAGSVCMQSWRNGPTSGLFIHCRSGPHLYLNLRLLCSELLERASPPKTNGAGGSALAQPCNRFHHRWHIGVHRWHIGVKDCSLGARAILRRPVQSMGTKRTEAGDESNGLGDCADDAGKHPYPA
jgi:hypothetical protein